MRRLIIWAADGGGFWMRYHRQLPPFWCESREAVCAIADRLSDQVPQY
jgi:hypothetical protein